VVAEDLIASTGNEQVLVAPLDLADQGSVAAFVSAWSGPLHILVNNAGIMATPVLRTPQGWEMQFVTLAETVELAPAHSWPPPAPASTRVPVCKP
jgi:NAD(P)-dependent dehydrogenase (short-subunit alcohol dehydrogenase family)